jgi:LPS sulfotransferase NodH
MLLISRIYAFFDFYFSLHSIEPLTVYYEDVVNDVIWFKNKLERSFNMELNLDYETDCLPEKQSTSLNLDWEKKVRKIYHIPDLARCPFLGFR